MKACAVACAAVALTLAAAEPVAGQAPATLAGEHLIGPAGAPDTFSCSGPVSFDVTAGLAEGPYPGTFTERVTSPSLQSFQATFRIVSGATIITGTKTSAQPFTFSCSQLFQNASYVGGFSYSAVINSGGRLSTYQGTGTATWGSEVRFGGGVEQNFITSSLSRPCKPGNGYGDNNHCHSGPPGQQKK